MKHEFLRWFKDSKGVYGIAICKNCGAEYWVGDPKGCKKKKLKK